MRYQRAETPALLNGHEAALRFFAPCFKGADQSGEQLLVALVDSAALCIHVEHYLGEATSVDLPVRQIVAEEIKACPNVPKRLAVSLAHDVEETVCGPVLEYSPLLSDEDLLEIVATTRVQGALEAIARRRSIDGSLADAIVAARSAT